MNIPSPDELKQILLNPSLFIADVTRPALENTAGTVRHPFKGNVRAIAIGGDLQGGTVPVYEYNGQFLALGTPTVQIGETRYGEGFRSVSRSEEEPLSSFSKVLAIFMIDESIIDRVPEFGRAGTMTGFRSFWGWYGGQITLLYRTQNWNGPPSNQSVFTSPAFDITSGSSQYYSYSGSPAYDSTVSDIPLRAIAWNKNTYLVEILKYELLYEIDEEGRDSIALSSASLITIVITDNSPQVFEREVEINQISNEGSGWSVTSFDPALPPELSPYSFVICSEPYNGPPKLLTELFQSPAEKGLVEESLSITAINIDSIGRRTSVLPVIEQNEIDQIEEEGYPDSFDARIEILYRQRTWNIKKIPGDNIIKIVTPAPPWHLIMLADETPIDESYQWDYAQLGNSFIFNAGMAIRGTSLSETNIELPSWPSLKLHRTEGWNYRLSGDSLITVPIPENVSLGDRVISLSSTNFRAWTEQ